MRDERKAEETFGEGKRDQQEFGGREDECNRTVKTKIREMHVPTSQN